MAEKKDELIKIVGAENAINDPITLDVYSKDHSFITPMKPYEYAISAGKLRPNALLW